MSMVGAATVDDFRRNQGNELADSLFSGAGGHDLARLARYVSIERLFAALGPAAVPTAKPSWNWLCAADRAYALRYGVEHPPAARARQVVQLAHGLIESVVVGAPS
ncbi:MAG: hypothetical protein HY905_12000 [Deltaproteobacteria bacterium]|nr:hypothetical protein [Deltaproteobacteria bacterium]